MDCVFCKIAAGEVPGDILYRDEDIVAFRDINPMAPVHLLVIPVKHINQLAIAMIIDLEKYLQELDSYRQTCESVFTNYKNKGYFVRILKKSKILFFNHNQ